MTSFALAAPPKSAAGLAGFLPAMAARVRLYGPQLGGCLGALALLWMVQTPAQSTPATETAPATLAAAIAETRSVFSSGVVDTIRELAAEGGGGTRKFEMTVRMRDGTLRVSNETGISQWRPGDQIRMIGPQSSL